jgi:hypothetical protein
MRLAERLVWALLILIADSVAFALPLAAIVLAYVLVARPRWFWDWMERLYQGAPSVICGQQSSSQVPDPFGQTKPPPD